MADEKDTQETPAGVIPAAAEEVPADQIPQAGVPEGAPTAGMAPPVPGTDAIGAGEGITGEEPKPITQEDIAAEQQKQYEEAMKIRKAQFAQYLEQLKGQLDQAVAAGQLTEEGRTVLLKAEELKLDEDLLARQGIVQISQDAVMQFFKTMFEFNALLNDIKTKVVAMHYNHQQRTIDVVICHEDLSPVAEGEPIPLIRMPETAFNDFNLLLCARRKDSKGLTAMLRQGGWSDVHVQDRKTKIIVPR